MNRVTNLGTAFTALAAVFLLMLYAALETSNYFLLAIPFAFLIFYTGWAKPASVFYLLLLALPFSFEYNFTPSLGTDIPDEGLMLLTALLFTSYWVWRPASVSTGIWRHPLTGLLILHLSWILITVLISTDPWLSVKMLLAKLWYVAAFVAAPVLLVSIYPVKKVIASITISIATAMATVTIIILVKHFSTGLGFADINDAVSPFFRNHVNYSSMLVCTIPLWMALYSATKNRSSWFAIVIVVLILLTALFFAYSRGAWLALAVGLIAGWLLRKKLLVTAFCMMIIVAVAAIAWLKSNDRYLHYAHDYKTTIFHEDFRQHLVATYELKDVSTAERFYRWIAGVRMVSDQPWTGYGPNTFYDNYKPYAIPAFKTWVSANPERSTVHNYFLLLAIEQGIPGLVFFVLLTGAMFYYAQSIYHRTNDTFYKRSSFTIGTVLAMIITVNFLSDLIETDKIGSLFFLCLALLIALDVSIRRDGKMQKGDLPVHNGGL